MNSYIPKSPEQGRRFTPPSVARRLNVTDMSARFVLSATDGVEYIEPVQNKPVENNVIKFPVANVAVVNPASNDMVSPSKEQNGSNLATPEYAIPRQPEQIDNVTEAVEGNVVDMEKYRMVKDAQDKLEGIYGAA